MPVLKVMVIARRHEPAPPMGKRLYLWADTSAEDNTHCSFCIE